MPNESVRLFSLMPSILPGKKGHGSPFTLQRLLPVAMLQCPDTLLLSPILTSGRWCSVSITRNSEVNVDF